MKILFTGGGTGGHVFPIIAVIREMRKMYPGKDFQFFFLGPKDEFGSILLSQEGVETKNILAGKIRRYFSFENFLDILKIPIGIFQSFIYLLFRIRPKLIFSKGGYGALPVVLCAKILRIPVFIHESDVVPGLANKIAGKWAKKIFISFPRTEYFPLGKTILAGNPIRTEILDGSKEEAKKLFELTFGKPVILFLGGSQGAQAINDFVLRILNMILKDFEIIHQCGRENFNEVKNEARVVIEEGLTRYYHPYPFLNEDELKHAYAAADFIVSRAGSGSIFEIAAVGKPSVLVPLPSAAADHQSKNAYAYAEDGACVVIEQENLTPNFFLEKIRYLFLNTEDFENMKSGAKKFAKPLAAKTIARHILEYFVLS